MQEIVKSKKRKYYYVEDKVYKCETCGKIWKDPYEITYCNICGKDICPNCNCVDLPQFIGELCYNTTYYSNRLYLNNNNSRYELFDLHMSDLESSDCTMTKYTVHKECANQRMDAQEYKKQLLSIVQHFNNSVELLNNNAFKETKTYEQLLNDKYASQLEHYEEQNKQYQEQLNQYKQELTQGIKSPSYTKYKNLTPKQLQMLELID